MMKMNKNAILGVILCTIFMAFPSQSIAAYAQAQEGLVIDDGKYQIELSFPTLEDEQQDSFFSKEATLIVKNGLYQLSLPMYYPDIITDLQIVQLEKIVPSKLDKIENLVQFDLYDLTQPMTINGTAKLPFEEGVISFTEQLTITIDSLKLLEESPPSNSIEEPSVDQEVQPEKEWILDYVLLADGKAEPSMMNTYVHPTATIIEKDDKYYAQMTILNADWVTSFTVEQQGQQVEPKEVSLIDNSRVVEFEVTDFEKLQRMWIEVTITELAYHHQYFVDLQFDKEQVATFLGKTTEAENARQPAESIPSVPTKEIATIVTEPANAPITKVLIAAPEENRLAFDRTLDEDEVDATEEIQQENVIEETATEQVIDNTQQQIAQLDKVKIVLLVAICLLSGLLLIRRIKSAKKETMDQE